MVEHMQGSLMWRTIHMTGFDYFELAKICHYAIERSCSLLIDIEIEYFGTDDILECIAQNTSNLWCMRLVDCSKISNKGFINAVKKLPWLEEVCISLCSLSKNSVEALGRSCPLLKVLKYEKPVYGYNRGEEDHLAVAISETMSKLCYLDIKGNSLTNIGLLAILDGCPLLEYLDIDECFNLKDLSNTLRKRCIMQIKDLRLPNPNINYEYINFEIIKKRAQRVAMRVLC
ncbi:F-box protein SKIP19 [Trifolium pratense]|uniref:F-box protein SKIP19 n=1 Tax=Trifolium pratense TaxID=57577 RepID=A0A2K3KEZ0_TRIPR|nr:F-box protein SKIP19 [Trifolium pratense]